MFPSSIAVVAIALAITAAALAGFGWAWWVGAFNALDAQARAVLDDADLRLERPWESPRQRAERIAQHGGPLPASPGDWGGSF